MKFNIMDRTGHSVEELSTDTLDGTSEAMKRFAELVQGQKYAAAAKRPNGKMELIRAFDPNAEELVFVPPLQGG